MPDDRFFDKAPLDAAGLNLQAVFDLAALPEEITGRLDAGAFRQLILLGHGGRRLWQAVQQANIASEHPIDDFTVATVEHWFANSLPGKRYRVLYPGNERIGLQALGKLAGWHHASPFMVGISPRWGSWYAYRAVLLADTAFAPTRPLATTAPCDDCRHRPCLAACPAGALAGGRFSLEKCIAWRKRPASSCRETCLARLACPVGSEHRYDVEQLRHTYAISLRMIEQYREWSASQLDDP